MNTAAIAYMGAQIMVLMLPLLALAVAFHKTQTSALGPEGIKIVHKKNHTACTMKRRRR